MRRLGQQDKVSCLHGHLLTPLAPLELRGQLSGIVSNPPYIPKVRVNRRHSGLVAPEDKRMGVVFMSSKPQRQLDDRVCWSSYVLNIVSALSPGTPGDAAGRSGPP